MPESPKATRITESASGRTEAMHEVASAVPMMNLTLPKGYAHDAEQTGMLHQLTALADDSSMQPLSCVCDERLDRASAGSGMAMAWVCDQHGAMSVDTRRLPADGHRPYLSKDPLFRPYRR